MTAGALSGCIGAFNPETDATSPVAPRVQALVDANRHYPRWEDFPPAPEGLPAPTELAAKVGTLTTAGGALAEDASRIEWTLGDPAAFEAEVAARVNATGVAPATSQTVDDIDAFAARLRERGKAPPAVPRQ